MRYRSDIDGLRAIAVLAVIVFHSQLLQPGGGFLGFLGVDAFFTISGFLITGIIHREIDAGSFSLIDFYRRRVVRILPALLAMILIVLAAGAILFLPTEIRGLGKSAAAAAGLVSNLYFWSGVNYFAATKVTPLLHTWSLGVEEQFYLAFPLFMLLLALLKAGAQRWILGAATAGSLALAWGLGIDHFAAAFYLLPCRGWELGLGALVAIGAFPTVEDARANAALGWIGLAMLLSSFVTPTLIVGMPRELLTCTGTALLLAYGEGSGAGRLLSVAPLRWIGLISYSLYLWHMPMFEFGRYLSPVWNLGTALAATALSLVAAALSYYLIETPLRRRFHDDVRPSRIVAIGLGASLAMIALSLAVTANARWIRPLPADVQRVLAVADYRSTKAFDDQFGAVQCRAGTMRYNAAFCLPVDPARRNIIVLGDSHSAHLWRAIAERFPDDRVMQASSTGCLPLIGARAGGFCREMFATVMRDYIAPARVQAVVLSADWTERELALVAPTIAAIRSRGIEVLLVGPSTSYIDTLPGIIARSMLRGDPAMIDRARMPGTAELDAQLRRIAAQTGARYYSLYDQQCPQGHCRALTASGDPLYFDDAHLTMTGARELVSAMPRP